MLFKKKKRKKKKVMMMMMMEELTCQPCNILITLVSVSEKSSNCLNNVFCIFSLFPPPSVSLCQSVSLFLRPNLNGHRVKLRLGTKVCTGTQNNHDLIQSVLNYFQKQPYKKHLEFRGDRTIPESTD